MSGGKLATTARAAGGQDLAAADGGAARTETVAALADQVARLESALHRICLIIQNVKGPPNLRQPLIERGA